MEDATRRKLLKLHAWLQNALELEFATIPPYLVALLSIKLPTNREPAELIRSVMIEEMLHLALVANVMNAVGVAPRLDASTVPHYPIEMKFEGRRFRNREFPINLEPFGLSAITTFMKIEEPEQPQMRAQSLSLEMNVPALTIGEFYRQIIELLTEIEREAPGELFVGSSDRQLSGDYYWAGGGALHAVNDLDSAVRALDLVVAQGEGAWSSAAGADGANMESYLTMGHYYRFSEIFHRRRYRATDDPSAPPTGEPMPVDYEVVYPIKVNPQSADYPPGSELERLNLSFNRRYARMLINLRDALSGAPKALYASIMDGMHALTPIAHSMMKISLEAEPSRVGCPTFEWREPDAFEA